VKRARGDRLHLAYDFSGREPAPRALVLTVNSRNEKGVPPTTHTFDDVGAAPKAALETDVVLHRERHYDVYTSTVAGDPPQPSASRFTEIAAVHAEKDQPFGQEVARKVGRLFARIRGDG
jgi:hypothetical protein